MIDEDRHSQYRDRVDISVGTFGWYSTIDARELRSDSICIGEKSIGQWIIDFGGGEDYYITEIKEIYWENRTAITNFKTNTGHHPPISFKDIKYMGSWIDSYLPASTRLMKLETIMKSMEITV